MTLPLDDIVFRARALAQTHPFSREVQGYVNRMAARERESQPSTSLGDWAVHAVTAGYCLRRVEEIDSGATFTAPLPMTADLDDLSDEIARRIRWEDAQELLLYPEDLVVAALDRLIAGDARRRLGRDARRDLDEEMVDELEEYIAGWIIKGYALRVAEQILGQERVEESI